MRFLAFLQEAGNQIKIVNLSEKDIDKFVAFRKLSKSEYVTPMSKKQALERIGEQSPSTIQKIVLLDDEVVGQLFMKLHRGGIADLQLLSVLESHQGHGIGQQLLKLCDELATKAGCTSVQLVVHQDNSKAIDWYKRMGYKQSTKHGSNLTLEKKLP